MKSLRAYSIANIGLPKYKYPLILGLIILFHAINNAIWLWIDTLPPLWDEAFYMSLSLLHYKALRTEGPLGFLKSFISADPYHAPLVTALPSPIYLTIGISEDKTLIVNMMVFAALLALTYCIGKKLLGAPAGAFAAFLVSTYPITFGLSRIFLVECALIAIVTLSIYLLLLTDKFAKSREAICLGIALGLGMLTKVFFPIFLVGPIVVSLYPVARNWLHRHRLSNATGVNTIYKEWMNFLICMVIAIGLASVWYIPNMADIIRRSLVVSYGETAKFYGPANPLTPTAIASYFILFTNYDISFLGLVLLIASLLIGLISKQFCQCTSQQTGQVTLSTSAFWLLISWIIIPYMAFSTAPNQDLKNIAPITPAIALVSVWGLLKLRPYAVRIVVMILIALLSFTQFFAISYGIPSLPNKIALRPISSAPWLEVFWQDRNHMENPHNYVPAQEDWEIPAILKYIEQFGDRKSYPAVVGIVPSHLTFEVNAFVYYAFREKIYLSPRAVALSEFPGEIDYSNELLKCDFVITKSGYQGPAFANTYNDKIFELLNDPSFGFVEAPKKFDLPDASQATIFFRLQL